MRASLFCSFGGLQDPEMMRRSFTYRVPREFWEFVAPTENEQYYLNRVVQGQVHDGNAYASGGVQGHAGLFSSSRNATSMLELWLGATPNDDYLNSTTVKLFTTVGGFHPSMLSLPISFFLSWGSFFFLFFFFFFDHSEWILQLPRIGMGYQSPDVNRTFSLLLHVDPYPHFILFFPTLCSVCHP